MSFSITRIPGHLRLVRASLPARLQPPLSPSDFPGATDESFNLFRLVELSATPRNIGLLLPYPPTMYSLYSPTVRILFSPCQTELRRTRSNFTVHAESLHRW